MDEDEHERGWGPGGHDAARDVVEDLTRFRELFENAPDGIFIADADGRYTYVNPAGCRLLGFSREELVGKSITELVGPADLREQAALKERLQRGAEEMTEWRLRRKDGTFVEVEISANALPGGQMQAFVRDLTTRRAAEAERRLSDARYQAIVAISADAIVTIDDEHRIALFNEGATAIFGYSPGEILGAPLEVLLPARFRAAHGEHVRGFAEGPPTARGMGARAARIVGLRKSGEEFAAQAAISHVVVAGKRVLTVSVRDVSEQKRAEDEARVLADLGAVLVEAGADYTRLLRGAPGVIVGGVADWCSVDVVVAGDVRRLRIAHVDPAMTPTCEALASYAAAVRSPVREALGERRSVLVSDVAPGFLESIAEDAEQLRLMRALDPGSFIVVPLCARGQALGSLGLGRSRFSQRYGPRDLEVAERLASRIALAVDNARLHEAVARAVRARDEVLAIVAHDLRNPLNAISLWAQTLRRRDGLPERRDQTIADSIQRTTVRMNRLIGDLLDVARLEGEGPSLSLVTGPVPPASLLEEAVAQQASVAAGARRVIEAESAEGLPDVCVDRHRILQVFANLLGNAVKFSRHRIRIGATSADGEVVFRVSDDGPGVPAEDAAHLFDRFWQATRSDRRGVGLGLTIAKGIVEAHRGRIWLEGEPGTGATFCFALPTALPPHG